MNTNHCNFSFVDLQLQDLAASPDIRDPSLNTAQCVIQGHKPKFSDTKGHIVKMSVVCSIFAMNAGFIFSWAMLNMAGSGRVTTTAKAIWFSSFLLSVLCIFYFFVACVLAFHFSCVFFATLAFPVIWTVCESIFSSFICHILFKDLFFYHKDKAVICLYTFGGNTICYISCWLVIGIRINPLWGLTVALSIFSTFAASIYAVYLHLEVTGTYPLPYIKNLFGTFYSRPYYNADDRDRVLISLSKFLRFSQSFSVKFVCLRLCIAVGSFFVFVILAGPSIGGQTGADELLKTSSLYFITAFITWATLRNCASNDARLGNERPQYVELQDTDNHTGDHPGGELSTPEFITGATLRNRASNDAPLRNERPQNVELQDTDNHTGDHPGGELSTPEFITGATLRNRASNDAPLRNERPQNVELQDTDNHTGDHRGELGTALVKCYYHDDRRVSNERSHVTHETRV